MRGGGDGKGIFDTNRDPGLGTFYSFAAEAEIDADDNYLIQLQLLRITMGLSRLNIRHFCLKCRQNIIMELSDYQYVSLKRVNIS